MRNVCFYVTDHGYGHAARDIALIRHLVRRDDEVRVFVKADVACEFLRSSLPSDRVEVMRRRNDFGIVNHPERNLDIDEEGTQSALKQWVGGWDVYVKREKDFCRRQKIELIISDVSPQPFIVAGELGIPGIAVSDFEWHWVYESLFGNTLDVRTIAEAYSAASLALVLPLAAPTQVFEQTKEVGLLSREIGRSKKQIRRKLGISEADALVYLGLGLSLDPSCLARVETSWHRRNLRLLVSWNVSLPGALKIPAADTESQDYIGACDLVVSRAGYSTVSEAITARVPMLLFHNFIEGEWLLGEVKALGIGEEITRESFLGGDWSERLSILDRLGAAYAHLPTRLATDGSDEVASEILKVLAASDS